MTRDCVTQDAELSGSASFLHRDIRLLPMTLSSLWDLAVQVICSRFVEDLFPQPTFFVSLPLYLNQYNINE